MTTPSTAVADRIEQGAGPTPNQPDDANTLAFPDGVTSRNTGAGNTGGMLALIPSDDDLSNLAIDGGEDAAELHLTLAYLGDQADSFAPEQMAQLHQQASDLADSIRDGDGPSPQGMIFGHAHFNPAGGSPCAVYLADGPGYPELHDAAVRIGSDALGDAMPEQHPVFTPHVTASYDHTPAALNYTGPVNFNRLRLALGDNQTDYPLYEPESDTMPDATTAAAVVSAEPNPAPIDPASLAAVGGTPVTFPVVIVEGMETSDGRYIEPGALSFRALPLPILAQTVNSGDGHVGAEVIGKLTELTRTPGPQVVNKQTGQPFADGVFVWQGKGEIDPGSDGGKAAASGYLTGNSADLSDMTADYEFLDPAAAERLFREAESGSEEAKLQYLDAPQRLVVSGGKIAATTLVPIPAFAEAYIQIDGQEMTPAADVDTSMVAAAWRSGEIGDDCALCEILASAAPEFDEDGYGLADAPNAATRKRAAAKGEAVKNKDGSISYPMDTKDLWDKAVKAVGRGGSDHDAIRRKIISVGKKHGWKAPDNWNPDGSLKGVAASGAPEFPALADFTDPQLSGPTALTVADDGRVFGHLATWGTCHIGFAGQCVTPPHSSSDYAYFATGAIRATDAVGELRSVAVGHITLGTGHAGMSLGAKPAAEHYDHTGSVVADVAAGEDRFGIWVAGRARDDADVSTLRAAALSGDWRKINGRLELVAALGVNVPGFPIPRARVASGEQLALVAAGAVKQTFDAPTAATANIQLDHEALADAIAQRLIQTGIIPDAGLDTGGDQAGSSDLAARERALAQLGLDEAGQRSSALRELAIINLEAAPFV